MGTTHTTQPVLTPASLILRHPSCPETRKLAEAVESIGATFVSHHGHWLNEIYQEEVAFQISGVIDNWNIQTHYWMVSLSAGVITRWIRLSTTNGIAEDVIPDEDGWRGEKGLLADIEANVYEIHNPA